MMQFYICWSESSEEELFHFVKKVCGVAILPMEKLKVQEQGNIESLSVLFVRKQDEKCFRYKRFRDESGTIRKVICPFDRQHNSLPYVEYMKEVCNGKEIARVWFSSISDKSVMESMNEIFHLIKKWAEDNCKEKEKDGVWIYTI